MRRGDALGRLLDVRRAQYLYPYLGQTRTISEAAAQLEVSVARMSYQTARLVEAGLVEKVNLIPRAGRPIAEYRSTAEEFIIPLAEVGNGDLETFLLESEEPLRRALMRSIALAYGDTDVLASELGLRLRRTATADIEVAPCTLDGREVTRHAGVVNTWHIVNLSAAEARALCRELQRVVDRYRRTGSGSAYVIRLAVAPLP